MHQRLFSNLCLAALFLISAVSFAAEKTVTAEVEGVDEAKKTITLGEQTFDVTRKTKITIDGKNASLADIKSGLQAKVKYDDKLDAAISISVFNEDFSTEDSLVPLKGTWLAFTEEANGKRIKKEEMKTKKKTLKVDGGKFTLSTSYYRMTGTIRAVPEDGPNAVDLDGTALGGEFKNGKFVGNGKEDKMLLKGIYDIKDKTLRLCYSVTIEGKPQKERPTEFETEEGGNGLCVSFEKTE